MKMLIKNPTSYISALSIKPTKLSRFLEWKDTGVTSSKLFIRFRGGKDTDELIISTQFHTHANSLSGCTCRRLPSSHTAKSNLVDSPIKTFFYGREYIPDQNKISTVTKVIFPFPPSRASCSQRDPFHLAPFNQVDIQKGLHICGLCSWILNNKLFKTEINHSNSSNLEP